MERGRQKALMDILGTASPPSPGMSSTCNMHNITNSWFWTFHSEKHFSERGAKKIIRSSLQQKMFFIIEIESLKFVLFKLCWIQIHLKVVKPKTINHLYLTQINDYTAAAACSKTIQLVFKRVHERNILPAPRLEDSIYQLVPSGSWCSLWLHPLGSFSSFWSYMGPQNVPIKGLLKGLL